MVESKNRHLCFLVIIQESVQTMYGFGVERASIFVIKPVVSIYKLIFVSSQSFFQSCFLFGKTKCDHLNVQKFGSTTFLNEYQSGYNTKWGIVVSYQQLVFWNTIYLPRILYYVPCSEDSFLEWTPCRGPFEVRKSYSEKTPQG